MASKPKPGESRIYNSAFQTRGRSDVVRWDVMPIQHHTTIVVTFESVNSAWRQWIWLKTDRGLVINGIHGPSIVLWYDTAPREVVCVCQTRDGRLSVYNVWDSGQGYGMESQKWSSGMLVEEFSNGRRYRCNDRGFETNFDKLVFRIEW